MPRTQVKNIKEEMIQELGRYLVLKSALSSGKPRLPAPHMKRSPLNQARKLEILLFEILSKPTQ